MKKKISVVITSISSPNLALDQISQGCVKNKYNLLVIGDVSSPSKFKLKGCDFYDIKAQLATGFKFAQKCPEQHYTRKNIGYLLAAKSRSDIIIDTDDDNLPYPEFFHSKKRRQSSPILEGTGFTNVYKYFSDSNIWPRGFPLSKIHSSVPNFNSLPIKNIDCPIQQGLADKNPDVDAIFRLVMQLPQYFRRDRKIAFTKGSWCPFNSQNTIWWRDAFKLLYLPSSCSFRMTDIIRSFVAQRIAWSNNWGILFHGPTMYQERNKHDLMQDFTDEIPGYLGNELICEELEGLTLKKGHSKLEDNLRTCYKRLIKIQVVEKEELQLLDTWLEDLNQIIASQKFNDGKKP